MFYWIVRKLQIQKLYFQLGAEHPLSESIDFARRSLTIFILCTALSIVISFISNDISIVLLGIISSLIFIKVKLKNLKEKIKYQNQSRLSQLPIVLTRWCVLLSAGTNIQAILHNNQSNCNENSILHSDLTQLGIRLKNGQTLSASLQEFSNQCNLIEISKLVHQIQLHLTSGEDLLQHFIRLNQDMWLNKKYAARKQGEETSTKLLFPMMILLINVMATLMFPVYTLMKGGQL